MDFLALKGFVVSNVTGNDSSVSAGGFGLSFNDVFIGKMWFDNPKYDTGHKRWAFEVIVSEGFEKEIEQLVNVMKGDFGIHVHVIY